MKSNTMKFISTLILAGILALLSGCVTVGYDFIKQQATVTVTPSTKGLAK
jgi:starvation-inducible outer membrane lipoprotein